MLAAGESPMSQVCYLGTTMMYEMILNDIARLSTKHSSALFGCSHTLYNDYWYCFPGVSMLLTKRTCGIICNKAFVDRLGALTW